MTKGSLRLNLTEWTRPDAWKGCVIMQFLFGEPKAFQVSLLVWTMDLNFELNVLFDCWEFMVFM